jgi:hypothetical protein
LNSRLEGIIIIHMNIKRHIEISLNVIPTGMRQLVALLFKHRNYFSPTDARLKADIIQTLRKRQISGANDLISYHEALCFMQAYPDNPTNSRLVDEELGNFAARIEQYKKSHHKDTLLDDTGIVDTVIYYPYNLPMARWLSRNFGGEVEIDWAVYRQEECDPLLGLLPLFAFYSENDAIDDEERGTVHWIKRAANYDNKNTLRWLLDNLDHLKISEEIKQYFYDNAELLLKWNLGRSRAARTLAKLPDRPIYYQRSPIKKIRIDLAKSIRKPAPLIRLISGQSADLIIETLTRALLPRHRELYPLTYANRNEVYQIFPGRGLETYFIGMKPEFRLPLEADYSALLIKNGVPIGYGISVVFFDRCEIALNIFDTFRSSEASFIFEQFVRVFYHHFAARNFLMRKYQVGDNNEEGIKSGAYWFYYKMGFRSLDPQIDMLAHEEWQRIINDKSYRTDTKTLKRLARSDLHWAPFSRNKEPYHELAVTDLGYAVTNMIASKFDGDGKKALGWAVKRVKKALSSQLGDHLSKSERLQLEHFAPLIALIPDLENWSQKAKIKLAEIIKAKGGPKEIEYAKKLQKHQKLYDSFWEIARGNLKADS